MVKVILTFLMASMMCLSAQACDLLVLAKTSCADPLCNKPGDVVSIRPDGTDWSKQGAGYADPMWKIIKLPGVTMEACQKYLEPLTEPVDEVVEVKVDATIYDDAQKLSEFMVAEGIKSIIDVKSIAESQETTHTTEDGGQIVLSDSKVMSIEDNGIVSSVTTFKDVYTVDAVKTTVKTIRDRKYSVDPSVLTAMDTAKQQILSVPVKQVATYTSKIIPKDVAVESVAVMAEKTALEEKVLDAPIVK